MIPYLKWNEDEDSEIPTLEELNRLIGQLEIESQTSRAFTVTQLLYVVKRNGTEEVFC